MQHSFKKGEYLFNVWPKLHTEGHWGTLLPRFFFFTACPNCVNDIWQKFPWAGSVARKVLASLYQSIWLMFPCLELPLDGNLLWASLANWNQISSTAWCDIDPYSTPRQPIDQYWFTIKNTPLLVQHCDRCSKARQRGKEIFKKKERDGERALSLAPSCRGWNLYKKKTTHTQEGKNVSCWLFVRAVRA